MGASPAASREAAAFGIRHGLAGATVNALRSSGLGTDEDLENAGWVTRLRHRRRRIGGLRVGQSAQRGSGRAGAAARSGRLGSRSVDQYSDRLGPNGATTQARLRLFGRARGDDGRALG